MTIMIKEEEKKIVNPQIFNLTRNQHTHTHTHTHTRTHTNTQIHTFKYDVTGVQNRQK